MPALVLQKRSWGIARSFANDFRWLARESTFGSRFHITAKTKLAFEASFILLVYESIFLH